MLRFSVALSFLALMLFSCSENDTAQSQNIKDTIRVENPENEPKEPKGIDSAATGLNFIPSENYLNTINEIKRQRLLYDQLLSNTSDSAVKDSTINVARFYFTNQLLNRVIPHWYGTVWDFNGYTNKPGIGVIACGYFVSTTLKHTGLNINRYKMAQQIGLNEARTLEDDRDLIVYRFENYDEAHSVISKLKTLKDGLYFVGLSNHVGYLYIKNKTPYFIHSNYIDGYVMVENAEFSYAFVSDIYVIADITYNDNLILKWIKHTEIPVIQTD